jgi:class 3 adenylate cyclase
MLQVINSYFQKIVDIIRSYNGDILKFAGDALIVEWKTTKRTSKEHTPAPLLATICAAKLVDSCSDFAVRIPTLGANTVNSDPATSKTALLNIHCAIGFGKVVGTHVGNQKRMEYVICGDALRQVAKAMTVAKQGEAVASPETIAALQDTLILSAAPSESQPQVIATKSKLHFRLVNSAAFTKAKIAPTNSRLSEQCQSWNMSMLRRLYDCMSPYVHPAVLADSSGPSTRNTNFSTLNASMQNNNRRLSDSSFATHNSNTNAAEDARLRDVLTVFLQPILPDELDLLGSQPVTEVALELLQQIMMIVQSEVEHFQGQLRQFIVDDKGLVVILNFGLQGSTFPNTVEERAIPCISNVKTLLKTELNLGCKMGATYGKAYCGVVGGVTRHEYAILGPSVNLAARLMCSKGNPGILVDQALKMKAGPNHPFKSLPSVVAKGYDKPVRIYEPASSFNKSWVDIKEDELVGRTAEAYRLLCMAKEILNGRKNSPLLQPASKMVFICGPYGVGKSSILSQSARQIEHLCRKRSSSHHLTRHIFSDYDSFKPFSIVRPLFLDILRKGLTVDSVSNGSTSLEVEIREQEKAQLHLLFLKTCLQAAVPMQYIEMFAGLIFTDRLSDGIGKWSEKTQKMAEWNRVARLIVDVYLQMTESYDLVVLALDDLSGMDEFSWKIVRRLYTKTNKFLIVGAARNEFGLNIQRNDWDDLKGDNAPSPGNNFSYMRLGPMSEDDIGSLTYTRLGLGRMCEDVVGPLACKRLSNPLLELELGVTRTVYSLSQGNPSLACQILDQMYGSTAGKDLDDSSAQSLGSSAKNVDVEGVKDVLLNRLDALSAGIRLSLNCGAMLGLSFSLADAISVLEKYNDITNIEDQAEHAELVRQSLFEAEKSGFLSSSQILAGPGISFVLFKFPHPLLREVISQQTLQEWKDRIQQMIDSVKCSEFVPLHDSWRGNDVAVAESKPIRSV